MKNLKQSRENIMKQGILLILIIFCFTTAQAAKTPVFVSSEGNREPLNQILHNIDANTVVSTSMDGSDLVLNLENGNTIRTSVTSNSVIPNCPGTMYSDSSGTSGNFCKNDNTLYYRNSEKWVKVSWVDDLPAIDSTSCSGTTYYVSATGSDSDNGTTTETPWLTLSKVSAATSLAPGDCVLFNRGDTWTGQKLLIPKSGDATRYITFGAYGSGDIPVFDGTGIDLPANHGLIRGTDRSYIVIQDIRVQDSGIDDGATGSNPGIGFLAGSNIIVQRCEVYNTDSSGIRMNTSTNVSVLYNDVSMTNCSDASEQISLSAVNTFEVAYNNSYDNCRNVSGSGIDAKQGSHDGTIHHNTVWGIEGANGIYVDAWNADTSNIQIYNNYVHDVGRAGISIGAETGGALHNVTVHHNVVERALKGGLVFHDEGTTGNSVYDIHIYNNTLYQNGTEGTAWEGGVRIFDSLLTGVTFKNNIFSNAYNWQIAYDPGKVQPEDITMDYNVIYGTQANAGGWTAISGTNAITTDPLYTAAGTGDFTLQSGSPAINACDNSVWQGTPNIKDYAGVAITDGSGNIIAPGGVVNCGAYE